MAGLGLSQMNSLLNSQGTLNSVKDLNSNRNMIKGQMGVLGAEIKLDQGRGLNTENKEKRYALLENNADSIMEKLGETADELNDRIAEDNEKIREEETAKAEATEKAEKAGEASQSGEAISSGTTAASTDTVDISMFAQNVAATAPAIVPEIPVAQTAQVGEVIDVKA